MIGVIAKPGQVGVVQEFFELFKTPWETYRPGVRYDVIIATATQIPDVSSRLLLVFGPENKTGPIPAFQSIAQPAGLTLEWQGSGLPIYAPSVTFRERDTPAAVKAREGVAGIRVRRGEDEMIRLGYDLFEEVRFLLGVGQPAANAAVPTLDLHIEILRSLILSAGIPVVEVTPQPAGYNLIACLTHDIDFVGIKRHRLDHTMWGFLYRSTVGAVRDLFQRKASLSKVLRIWRAAASLPLVYLGWVKDFWEPFEWYLRAERGLGATYFLIPFKGRAGEHVPGRYAAHRATGYDVTDIPDEMARLMREGCELGVHGIDAWHDAERGRQELARIAAVTGNPNPGIRMHWLLGDEQTIRVLEAAGYAYDSSIGYNETVGYRSGTTQAFRPLGARSLMELPLHVQDGALFYASRSNLTEAEGHARCDALITHARAAGGVFTIVWHDRSHGPERFWGGFYSRVIDTLKSSGTWFATAGQAVAWFRSRRHVRFEQVPTPEGVRVRVSYDGGEIVPPLRIRVHRPSSRPEQRIADDQDVVWNGQAAMDIDAGVRGAAGRHRESPVLN